MQLPTDNHEPITFAIVIPNISRLLIYKDNWQRGSVMKKVITELIKRNLYSKLYIGNKSQTYCTSDLPGYFDCAIINIQIQGLSPIVNEPAIQEDVFIREIENKKNILLFHNTLIDEQRNVSCIDIGISIKSKTNID